MQNIQKLWHDLYGHNEQETLKELLHYIGQQKTQDFQRYNDKYWYQKAVVYSLYVQFFDDTIEGLQQRLPYLKDLGINCLWLLPILDSPMIDTGYDVSDYMSIRSDLVADKNKTKVQRLEVFKNFVDKAHEFGIRVVIDIVLNHSSNEHEFFQQASTSRDSPYHDYYVWSDDQNKYNDTRVIFEDTCTSNWKYNSQVDRYYLHRFYPQQPDWNYRNPQVLLYIIRVFVFWKQFAIDGFRLDATPFLWKQEGTNCESLPQCHTILKIIRATLDAIQPGTLLLAEACQPTSQTVEYFASGDECHAAYHFPLMPKIFLSLAKQDPRYITNIWQQTQQIPSTCQWFVFLRCHDELTLEMSDDKERKILYEHYCKSPQWSFRNKNGISARLSDLLDNNTLKINLAFSILLTLPGTPVLYYGDEIAMRNDKEFYEEVIARTGFKDTRNLCRSRMNWEQKTLKDTSVEVHSHVKNILKLRSLSDCFYSHNIEFVDLSHISKNLLAYCRQGSKESLNIVHNLSGNEINFVCEDMITENSLQMLKPYQTVLYM
ncbi:alpha-amylase family glycosyl hydrolase [Candidatus Uabimicrobium sp. HlEnr_7]|uniref:alpha-amylase family glycosyl hydrolase n=1 Tax=Candidatus Uabimicrobium helgolandensis TaxID=3095367 RepID=UPI003556F9F6